MSVLFVVVPLALLASAAAVVAFIWAVNRGQLDDLVTPAHRMLEEDQAGPLTAGAPPPPRSPRGSSAPGSAADSDV
jgi:cbb3-type cytochrome oxidase maturation protein